MQVLQSIRSPVLGRKCSRDLIRGIRKPWAVPVTMYALRTTWQNTQRAVSQFFCAHLWCPQQPMTWSGSVKALSTSAGSYCPAQSLAICTHASSTALGGSECLAIFSKLIGILVFLFCFFPPRNIIHKLKTFCNVFVYVKRAVMLF